MFNKTDPAIFDEAWSFEKSERAVLGLCKVLNRYAHKLTLTDLQNDPRCAKIPNLSLDRVQEVMDDVEAKLWRGAQPFEHEVIYHTGPHHDDIMLGIMPFINRQLRSASNQVHFAIMTSGYHSVTDAFLAKALEDTLDYLHQDRIQMVHYPDFFEKGYRFKYEKDIHHYLDNVARGNADEMRRGFCHRILRDAVGLWHLKSVDAVEACFRTEIGHLKAGMPNTPEIQALKGQVREFEEELVWAFAGTSLENIHHLRLGFYSHGEDFPNLERDVLPILNQLRTLKPTVMTVAMDSVGLGPNTHYKVMRSIAEAVRLWNQEADLSRLRIFGYRNVWSTYHPAEANVYVPVSLNAMAVFEKAFNDCYLTQVKAEFPNPDFDGPFSALAESIWVKQLKDVQLILGKNYFYENRHPLIRATHGLLFLKEMGVDEFVSIATKA
jgi:glucosamine-6-phosphate deaminase